MMSARLSSADTAWLHMDRPTNLMVINSVDLFDQPLDWARVKEVTQTRLIDRYPRFRQRVVESRLPMRAPRWEDDPDFALEHHMHHLALPAPGGAHIALLGARRSGPAAATRRGKARAASARPSRP
jgi:diacylglycerol O-acyltransferase / wax synthase